MSKLRLVVNNDFPKPSAKRRPHLTLIQGGKSNKEHLELDGLAYLRVVQIIYPNLNLKESKPKVTKKNKRTLSLVDS